jgi:hypothetical protein
LQVGKSFRERGGAVHAGQVSIGCMAKTIKAPTAVRAPPRVGLSFAGAESEKCGKQSD